MSVLIVAMNGIEVGYLSLQTSGAMSFQYQQGWLDRPGARAISLSLPKGFPEAIAATTFTGLQGRANVILDQMGAA